jgi:hypothetical protein
MWRREIRNELYPGRSAKSRSGRPTTNAFTYDPHQAPGSQDGANMTGGVAQIERNNEWASRASQR